MVHRLRRWLSSLPDDQTRQALEQERALRLAAESELRRLRLDLKELEERLAQARVELQRQSQEAARALNDHLEAQLETVLTPLATPLAQLLTQHDLITRGGKELGAKDLLATSRRLWQGLTPIGVEALETIGELVPFDPDRHQPLSQASLPGRGEPVRVRMPGIQLKGRVLKPAAVEPLDPLHNVEGPF
ncbi:MAG: nucleotide exchange factor GrpE [Cyanobacteriota bacterium]